MPSPPSVDQTNGLEIAVIGIACRYPGASNVDEYWRNLQQGVESISFFSNEELEAAGVPHHLLSAPNYVKARGIVEDAELFDAGFFKINPNEAKLVDPQHRLFLQCAWEALESSGYAQRHPGPVGVYAGAYDSGYLLNLLSNPDLLQSTGPLLTHISTEKDYLTTRVSYKLDLQGPSLTVQTACSTSLVAVHLASQGLLSGACDLALAGGVTLRAQQRSGYAFEREGIFSPDGHCRAFDAAAQGTVSSSGVGVVVLKRLEDALADGDTVRAVIKGSAITNDGAGKVGFTAPSVDGQARAIHEAQLMADVDPGTIGYVEAHGSGTALGDPIEIEALARVFRASTERQGFCAVGSVKSNIGHTHAAAGVAGLIKTVLALEHGLIPPSLHFERPNPKIDFERSPFYVNTALSDWKTEGAPRRAGVSSFGTGGTNAHAVLEQAPPPPPEQPSRPWQLVVLSARTQAALDAATGRLAEHLRRHPEQNLADVAYTLQVGRKVFDHRQVLVCRDGDEATTALEARDPTRLSVSAVQAHKRSVTFMFPGLGDQYPQMGQYLYGGEPVFREHLDRCGELLHQHLGVDPRRVLYPSGNKSEETTSPDRGVDLRRMLGRGEGPSTETQGLNKTLCAQPAMFMVEFALAQLWMSWGVRPEAMIGYSIGEYVAACLAGVLALEDAAFLVARRARLIEQLPTGAMLAVPLCQDELSSRLGDALSIAAVNGSSLCVVAGATEAVVELEGQLSSEGMACRRLQTSHPFHSKLLEPAATEFTELAKAVALRPPQIPYMSNVTGSWITAADATDPSYWARHMCQPVRFADGVEELWRTPDRLLLEVGPGQALSSLALQLLRGREAASRVALSSLPSSYDRQPEPQFLLHALGRLWLAGVPVDWPSFYAGQRRRRVPLPTYPFEGERHWVEPGRHAYDGVTSERSLRKRPDIAEWFSVPAWASTPPLAPVEPRALGQKKQRWLVFVDDCGIGDRIASWLERHGQKVTTVVAGERLQRLHPRRYAIDAGRRGDYDALLQQIHASDGLPQVIVHFWTLTADEPDRPSPGCFEELQQRGFYSLLFLGQALAGYGDHPLHVAVVSNHVQQVTGEDVVSPEKATVLGPCKVLPQEHRHITCRSIDVVLHQSSSRQADELVDRLVAELLWEPADPIVAYRGQRRWRPVWQAVRVDHADRLPGRLREGGVYLITGGLGGIGLVLSEYLARSLRARLVLTSRSGFPGRHEWKRWLATHDEGDETVTRIRRLEALEGLGAEILVVKADASDLGQMQSAVNEGRRRFGEIHGVIHAAGVPGAGVMQLKRPEVAASVLAPKAKGALVLEAVFKDAPLDFLVLCSSTLAIAGGIGQVDYCAANTFLDVFAQRQAAEGGPFTVSINWDAWQEVGMAVRTVGQVTRHNPPNGNGRETDHPLLQACLVDAATHAIYATELNAAKDWLVDEHRMLGRPVIPGTAYLEMVRAAVEHQGHAHPMELREVLFLAPAVLEEDKTKEIHVVLEKGDGSFRFSVVSRNESAAGGTPWWQEHVNGRVVPLPATRREQYDPSKLIDQGCFRDAGELIHTGPMTFGPRSRCLERVWSGEGQALALLSLPERFHADLHGLGLHPFLLDIATGFASLYLEQDYYMPLRYGAIEVRGKLPARLYSWLRYRAESQGKETVSFDVTIVDEHGHVLLRIEDFTMKKARALETKLSAVPDKTSGEVVVYDYPSAASVDIERSLFSEHLEQGILPEEGAEAFARILARNLAPQVVVAAKDLASIITQVDAARAHLVDAGATSQPTQAHPRPNLRTPYVAPRDELERTLVDVWQELLGVEQVGVHDNFFDLGGHSLLGIQLLARLRKTVDAELSLQSLFEALTIAGLARLIEGRSDSGTGREPGQVPKLVD